MAFRREIFDRDRRLRDGCRASRDAPCRVEETELCIRIGQGAVRPHRLRPGDLRLASRDARSGHDAAYFLRRCWFEGYSKAVISGTVGAGSRHPQRTDLRPSAYFARGVAAGSAPRGGQLAGPQPAGAISVGTIVTAAGSPRALVRGPPSRPAPRRRCGAPHERRTRRALDPPRSVRGLSFDLESGSPCGSIPRHLGPRGGQAPRRAARTGGAPARVRPDRRASRSCGCRGERRDRRSDADPRSIPGGECVASRSWRCLVAEALRGRDPTRNRADSLARCVRSLAGCDYPDFEVIVVDNGSSSLDKIESVLERCRRI